MPDSTLSLCLLEANSHAQAWGQGSRTSLSSDPDSGGRGVGDRKDGDSQAPLPTPSSAYPPEVKSPVARGGCGGAHSEAWQQLGFGFLTSFCCKESQ